MGMVAPHADGDAIRHKLNQSVFHLAPSQISRFTIHLLGLGFTECKKPLVGDDGSALSSDALVDLWSAIAVKIEQSVLVLVAPIQVACRNSNLIAIALRLGEDLA